MRDVTNPFTGSVRAHGEQKHRTTARRHSNIPVSNFTRAGSREWLGPSGTRSRARGKHGGAYQGRDAGGGAVQGRWCRAPAATLGAEIVGRSLRWSSGLLGSKDRFVKILRVSHRGQQARSGTRGANLRQRTGSPPAASGANSMASRAGVAGAGLGKFYGAEVELRRGLAGARMRRCGESMAEQRALRSGATRRRRLGFARR